MPLDSIQDLLIEQLRDLYSAEEQILRALPKLAKAASNTSLTEAFTHHLEQSKGHVARLDHAFEMLEVSSRGPKCHGMEGLLQEGGEMIAQSGDFAVLDAGLVADAQRIEHD